MNKKRSKLIRLSTLAMLTALAYLLMVLVRLPLFPSAPYLQYDPKDVILVFIALFFGPLAAFLSTVCVAALELVTVSTTGLFGFLFNLLASLSFVLPCCLIYRRRKTLPMAVVALVSAVLLLCLSMLLWNWGLTPLYLGIPRSAVVPLLFPVILPFNLIKGLINSCLILLLYKPLGRSLRHFSVFSESSDSALPSLEAARPTLTWLSILISGLSVAVLLTLLLFYYLHG